VIWSKPILRVPDPGNNARASCGRGVAARFRRFDDNIILTSHSKNFETSEKIGSAADDVTRLKYPWPNVAT